MRAEIARHRPMIRCSAPTDARLRRRQALREHVVKRGIWKTVSPWVRGQAAALVYGLGGGAITDIVPKDGSPNNVTGSVTGNVNTSFSADFLAAPLGNTTTYYSALYNSPFSTRWFVITFGTDTSLTTGPGWDNVTGVGTSNGLAFINAIAP